MPDDGSAYVPVPDPASADRAQWARDRAAELSSRFNGLDGLTLIRAARETFPGRLALVSSFGAESAALLDMVARVDRALPVVFLDTLKLFPETLAYRDRLIDRLGLTDVRSITPDPEEIARQDPDGDLWRRDPDACCALRKVVPLDDALAGFDAWISGRKRFHGGDRAAIPLVEADGPRIKVNPLAGWSATEIETYYAVRDLPGHPLVDEGFLSIGCMPCTRAVAPGEDIRAGRWSGSDKTECGIHEDYFKTVAARKQEQDKEKAAVR